MSSEIGKMIQDMAYDVGLSIDKVQNMVEEALLTAYKKKFGTIENAEVEFDDVTGDVKLYAKKEVINGVYNPVFEIELEEAVKYDPSIKEGEFILIEIDPKEEFGRISVQNAKQKTRSDLKEVQRDSLFSEFNDKKGKIIKGYVRRKKNGTLYVEIDRSGQKFEAVLPEKNQSPREEYEINDSLRVLVWDVQKMNSGVQVVLSRSHREFVRRLFEQEIPEIADDLVQIHNIVRDAGYRTKMAVRRMREDIDPVGACVGAGGQRIQSIIREIEGEKIDVIEYSPNIKEYIRSALSPAQVEYVIIQDEEKRQALVVVADSQLSFAIGKNGQNVRLANRLVDWTIDVKTRDQFIELYGEDALPTGGGLGLEALFTEEDSLVVEDDQFTEVEDVEELGFHIDELAGLDPRIADVLKANHLSSVEELLEIADEDLLKLEGLTAEDVGELRRVIEENVEVVEDEQREFVCPECNGLVQVGVTICPHCGVGLSFEYDEE